MNKQEWLKSKLDLYSEDPVSVLLDLLLNANEVLYMAQNQQGGHCIKNAIKKAHECDADFLFTIGYLAKDQGNG